MKKICILVLALFLFTGCEEEAENFSYVNERYGFSVEIPGGFVSETVLKNDNGEFFKDSENEEVKIYATGNLLPIPFLEKATLKDIIDYNINTDYPELISTYYGEDYYVQKYKTIVEEKDFIVCEKAFLNDNGSTSTVTFMYPEKKDREYKEKAELVINSFKKEEALNHPPFAEDENYYTYYGERYGFYIEVPKELKMGRPSQNGDGNIFVSDDEKVKLTAYGSWYTETTGKTDIKDILNEYIKMENKEPVYYKTEDKSFAYAFSEDGKIIYNKKYIKEDNAEISFCFEFPKDEKEKYKDVLKHIDETFKPVKGMDSTSEK